MKKSLVLLMVCAAFFVSLRAQERQAQDDTAKPAEGFTLKTAETITFDTDISFWEVTVTPPGLDGGDGIDQTTMHNNQFRVMLNRALITLTECSATAAYDPSVFTQIQSALNVNTTITITFPDLSTVAFYGFLRVFQPDALVEGTQPRCSVTIQPSNWDPTNKVEAGPLVTAVSGT